MWEFDWNDESTKRGVVWIASGLLSLLGFNMSPEDGMAVLAAGQVIAGALGALRIQK